MIKKTISLLFVLVLLCASCKQEQVTQPHTKPTSKTTPNVIIDPSTPAPPLTRFSFYSNGGDPYNLNIGDTVLAPSDFEVTILSPETVCDGSDRKGGCYGSGLGRHGKWKPLGLAVKLVARFSDSPQDQIFGDDVAIVHVKFHKTLVVATTTLIEFAHAQKHDYVAEKKDKDKTWAAEVAANKAKEEKQRKLEAFALSTLKQ